MFHTDYDLIQDHEVKEKTPFILSWGFDLGALKDSLKRVGQISPLVVKPEQNGYTLVCGYRRRLAMRELGHGEYKTLILPERVTEKDMLLIALEDNLVIRSMNDAEKACALGYLIRFFSPEIVIAEFMPRLGLPPRKKFLDRYLKLVSLGPPVLDALARGDLDPETGEKLARLDEPDLRSVLNLLGDIRPGLNRRRQIVTFLLEIGRREDKACTDILNEPEVRDIADNDRLDRPGKEKRVWEYLFFRRYPRLNQIRSEQARLLAGLNLPDNFKFHPALNFEGLDFRLEVTFSNRNELAAAAKAFEDLTKLSEMDDLLELG